MNNLEHFIHECPVCLDSHYVPYITECGHTFCLQCLEKVKECPNCRQKFPKDFQPIKNISLMKIMSDLRSYVPPKVSQPESIYSASEDWDEIISNNQLLANIYLKDWHYPTKVQSLAIPKIIEGKTLLIESSNGSGKTGSFVLGSLSRVNPNINELQVISISHSKEIKDMHFEVFSAISQNTGIIIERTQKYKTIDRPMHVLCGTPESVKNFLRSNKPKCSNICIIIDECDELLNSEQSRHIITWILSNNKSPQVIFYSATLMPTTHEFISANLRECQTVSVRSAVELNPSINVFNIKPKAYISKMKTVLNLLRNIPFKRCILFINTKTEVAMIQNYFSDNGYKSESISGDLSDVQRETIIERVMIGYVKVLISTDLLGRGFDCKSVDLVINYECPVMYQDRDTPNFEAYYHRCGRTGRHIRSGTVINVIGQNDGHLYTKILERFKINPKLTINLDEITESLEKNSKDYQDV